MTLVKDFIRSTMYGFNHILKDIYRRVLNLFYIIGLFEVENIPIVINNFNRLSFTKRLIEALEQRGYRNIIIVDNNSTYPPLLDYYKTIHYPVINKGINFGHLALWKSGLFKKMRWNYFVYTDSDVVPIVDCPKDFLSFFKRELDRNFALDKIGFGIRIDDLPDTFHLKKQVIAYEGRYWEVKTRSGFYIAPIDTTFALYKPFSNLFNNEVYTLRALRTASPFLIQHLPWYVDSKNLSEEESYYRSTANASSTISKDGPVYNVGAEGDKK